MCSAQLLSYSAVSLDKFGLVSNSLPSPLLPTLTAVSCEDCLVLVEVVVFVLVEVCLGNITLEGLRLNIVRNTSDIVRLDL